MTENLPLDLLYPVLDHLDRSDLLNTALVSSTFNRVATPLLYRAISSRISEEKVRITPPFLCLLTYAPCRFSSILVPPYFNDQSWHSTSGRSPKQVPFHSHPCFERGPTTVLGAVQLLRRVNPRIIEDITAALRLCTNLEFAKYIDDTDTPILNFLPILHVLITLPLKELVIRTHHDVGEDAWALLNKTKGIRRLSVWSLNSGPPRVLQGWADELSSTLTHLELGVRFL